MRLLTSRRRQHPGTVRHSIPRLGASALRNHQWQTIIRVQEQQVDKKLSTPSWTSRLRKIRPVCPNRILKYSPGDELEGDEEPESTTFKPEDSLSFHASPRLASPRVRPPEPPTAAHYPSSTTRGRQELEQSFWMLWLRKIRPVCDKRNLKCSPGMVLKVMKRWTTMTPSESSTRGKAALAAGVPINL